MSETTKTTSKTKIVHVPAAWAVYEVEADDLMTYSSHMGIYKSEAPSASVMEALVVLGKAKRLAVIHAVSLLNNDGDDEDESLFGEGDGEDNE